MIFPIFNQKLILTFTVKIICVQLADSLQPMPSLSQVDLMVDRMHESFRSDLLEMGSVDGCTLMFVFLVTITAVCLNRYVMPRRVLNLWNINLVPARLSMC